MKKTLIALAVLAASGASFAQVTLSGNFTTGFASTNTGLASATGGGSSEASGLGVDRSQINFTAVEDLGGGMRAVAKMSLAGADRSNESALGGGRDATLTLITDAGMFQLGSVRAGDYVSGDLGKSGIGAYYGQNGNAFAGKVFSALSNRDTITYILPMGAWTLAAGYQEGANLLGLGAGTSGAAATTAGFATAGFSIVSASYASGALEGNGTYMAMRSTTANVKSVTRLSGSYNFGVIKLGLGAQVTDTDITAAQLGGAGTTAAKATDLGLSATMPLGALTLGAQFVQRKIDDAGFTGQGVGTITGSALQATYALSKRTSVIGNYARWNAHTANDTSSQTNILLSHSF